MNRHNQPPLENITPDRGSETDNAVRMKMMAVGGAVLLGIFGVGIGGAYVAGQFKSSESQPSAGEHTPSSTAPDAAVEASLLSDATSLTD